MILSTSGIAARLSKRRFFSCLAATSLLTTGIATRAAPPPVMPGSTATPFRVERLDPAFDAMIAADVKLKPVASGFVFSDGPVWVRGKPGSPGYLLVVNIVGNVINKITPDGHVSVFMDNAGYTGTDFAHDGKLSFIAGLHILLIGPNCTGVDHEGRILWCAGQDRAIKRLEKDGKTTILADRGDGKRFNGPNDVAIAANGAIYFTDSDVGLRGGINGGLAEMPDAVWMWKDGKVTKVVARENLLTEPNGIALSPDDKYLYLSARGAEPGVPKLMRYPIKADGTAGPGEVFAEGPGIGDGMKTDSKGNIWSTGPYPGVVQITSPQGKVLGLLYMPTSGNTEPKKLICASALAFGGDDAKTLYITACDTVYAVSLKSPGVLEGPAN